MKKIIVKIGITIFILQLLMIVYFNLFTLHNHIGFDSSWALLKAVLVWNEKAIVSDVWVDQTSPFLDSSMPLAALLYGVIDNIFLAYGLSNIIVVILILYALLKILEALKVEIEAIVIAMNIIICPFLLNGYSIGNDLSYFSNVLSGPSFYAVRILTFLMILYNYILIYIHKKINKVCFLTFILVILCTLSSGVYIFMVAILPFILHRIHIFLEENNPKRLFCIENLYGMMLISCVVIGRIINKFFIGITPNYIEKTWSSIDNIFVNFISVIQGFLKLLTVLPVTNRNLVILSSQGLIRCFSICLFIILLVAVFKFQDNKIDLVKNVISKLLKTTLIFNMVVFGLFNARYGSELFEERYLVIAFFAIIIMLALYIDQIRDKAIFNNMLCMTLLICIFTINLQSDRLYIRNKTDYKIIKNIQNIVSRENSGLVYFIGNENFILARNMRIVDTKCIYKVITTDGSIYHWGDYTYYDDGFKYKGNTIFIATSGSKNVFDDLKPKMKCIDKIGNLEVFLCDDDTIRFTK